MWGTLRFLMFPRVVGKFSDGEEFIPVVLSSINEVFEVCFYPKVHSFGLPIGARVEGRAEVLFNASCFANCFGKVTGKPGVSVRYDAFWDAKQGRQMSQVECGSALSIDGFVTGDEFGCFGASLVNNSEDRVVFPRFR